MFRFNHPQQWRSYRVINLISQHCFFYSGYVCIQVKWVWGHQRTHPNNIYKKCKLCHQICDCTRVMSIFFCNTWLNDHWLNCCGSIDWLKNTDNWYEMMKKTLTLSTGSPHTTILISLMDDTSLCLLCVSNHKAMFCHMHLFTFWISWVHISFFVKLVPACLFPRKHLCKTVVFFVVFLKVYKTHIEHL